MGYLVMILQVELQGPNFLLFNSSIILWTQRTAENHLHLVYREERESLKSLPESPRSGRLEVARPLLTTFHSPELSHTCPHLTARESGKCSLCVCLRGQGSRFGDHGALSLPLASRITKEKNRDQFSTAPNPVFFSIALSCGIHPAEWLLIQITRTDRGTHTAWGQKRDWKVIHIFFLMVYFTFMDTHLHIWLNFPDAMHIYLRPYLRVSRRYLTGLCL